VAAAAYFGGYWSFGIFELWAASTNTKALPRQPAPVFSAAMRSLLQTSTNQGFTPEETTGIIVG
jgi:hypothetical protein